MALLTALAWCVAFGGLGFYFLSEGKKYQDYLSFKAKVKQIRTRGGNTAVMTPSIPGIGEFEFTFQDLGDYREGDVLDCMWDGKDPCTAQLDLRKNQKGGVYICFAAVALMVIIVILGLIF